MREEIKRVLDGIPSGKAASDSENAMIAIGYKPVCTSGAVVKRWVSDWNEVTPSQVEAAYKTAEGSRVAMLFILLGWEMKGKVFRKGAVTMSMGDAEKQYQARFDDVPF